MDRRHIAKRYLKYLEEGHITPLMELFEEDGLVESPIYGIKKASEFYSELYNDTSRSTIKLKGIFEENDSHRLALYFTYIWTLKNKESVTFDVVDIIEFNTNNKIKTLKIIYDTVVSRTLVERLKA
ncbi:nuclear transport factor 2 family protein [Aestuariivivens sediminis]|uniref:nuclear transport factor 2 family protein n=1 Tax=Aestuariivivens sediminis TaxID=2913557 RepID=UPI001F5AC008|nr:nuclear transport factor 2 family protein [Aestuariivivens sediminis]